MNKHWRGCKAAVVFALVGAAWGAVAQTGVAVPVAPVKSASVAQGFELDGVIVPVKQSTVALQATGRIASLLVKAGDPVRAGQLLAVVDDRATRAEEQRSKAQAQQTEAELRNAKANYERTRDLQAKGFVSPAALDLAESQYKAARAGQDQASALVKESQLAQGFTRVTAPYNGWVQQTLADTGDLAVQGKPLLTMYAPLPVWVVVQLPLSRSNAARSATQIEVWLTDAKGVSRWVRSSGRRILPLADPVAQTVEWRLDIPNDAAQGVVPGQQVRVRFGAGAAGQLRTLIVASAVLRRGELTAVYVVSGQSFVLKAVRLGADFGSDGVQVLAGLSVNDKVALDPVKAGMAGAQPAAQ